MCMHTYLTINTHGTATYKRTHNIYLHLNLIIDSKRYT